MAKFDDVETVHDEAVAISLPPSGRLVLGRLRFEPEDGITLQFIDQAGLEHIILHSQARYPVILGRMVNGPVFTLLDCTTTSTNFGAGGISDVKLIANHLLIGIQLQNADAALFDEIRTAVTDLNEWFGVSPIRTGWEDVPDSNGARRVTVTCQHIPQIGFTPLPHGPSFSNQQIISSGFDGLNRGFVNNQFEIALKLKDAVGLKHCIEQLFQLQAFLSILCGHQVFYKSVRLFRADLSGQQRSINVVQYLTRFARPYKTSRGAPEILLGVPSIRDALPTIWSNWTERYNQYQSAVELYVSTDLFGGQLLNFQLLAVMQALETLHRSRFGGTYLVDNDYAPVEHTLVNHIPPNVPPDLRQSLKMRIKFGNEYSLRKRLKSLASKLPGGAAGKLAELLHPTLKQFLERAVDTRNYLTHFTPDLKESSFDDEQIYWATRVLRWFFLSVFLTDVGVDERTLLTAFGGAQELAHAKQVLSRSSNAEVTSTNSTASITDVASQTSSHNQDGASQASKEAQVDVSNPDTIASGLERVQKGGIELGQRRLESGAELSDGSQSNAAHKVNANSELATPPPDPTPP